MKKTHRALLSILLVLALLATLPLTALAEEGEGEGEGGTPEVVNDTAWAELSGDYDRNIADWVTVNADGKVETNQGQYVVNNGEITNNGGKDDNRDAIIQSNNNKVENNYGLIYFNAEGAEVAKNYGFVGTYEAMSGENQGNKGDVIENYDCVFNIGGNVEKNSGKVVNLSGTVDTNNIDGVVQEYSGQTNTVETNYGTYEIYTDSSTPSAVYYGVHGEDEDGNKYYYKDTAENQSGNTAFVGYQEDTVVDLDEVVSQYKRDGYKLTEYKIQVYQDGELCDYAPDKEVAALSNVDAGDGGGDGEGEAAKPLYRISAPTLLKLTWEKIASIFKPAASTDSSVGGGGGAEAVPTSYKPKYIGLGSVIFINEKGYKVVEIKDDAYVVVSFDALPDEDVQDLDALYAKLFTPEQQKLIKNIGQLLDAEDVLAVFGKPGNHPVFEISKDLV